MADTKIDPRGIWTSIDTLLQRTRTPSEAGSNIHKYYPRMNSKGDFAEPFKLENGVLAFEVYCTDTGLTLTVKQKGAEPKNYIVVSSWGYLDDYPKEEFHRRYLQFLDAFNKKYP